MPNCIDCSAKLPSKRGGPRRCPACKAAWPKSPERLHKVRAQSAVHIAIKSGHLERRPCECILSWNGQACGSVPTHAHHEDYSKPLEVVWLCPYCHAGRHYQLRHYNPVPPLVIDRPGLPKPDRDW